MTLVYPLLASWIIAAYIHLVQYLYIFQFVTAPGVYLLFIPVIGLELWLGRGWPPGFPFRPGRMPPGEAAWGVSVWRRLEAVLRLLFWLAFYLVWVGFIGSSAQAQAQWLKWFAPQFYLQFYLVFRAEGWLTLMAFALWLSAYLLLTVRGKRWRLLTTMILPMALALALFFHLYNFGGIGGLFEGQVASQDGVVRVLNLRALDPTIPPHPRGLCYDPKQNALFVMFGCTYCNDRILYPTIVRYDLTTGKTHSFRSSNIRQVQCDDPGDTLFVAPWYQQQVYQLSRRDLSIVALYPTSVRSLSYWEPMSLVRDGPYLYISNDVEQAIVAYNLALFQTSQVLNLYQQGFVQFGGPAWNLLQSNKTRRLYFTTGPGENLFELEAVSLRVLQHRRFHDITGTALAIDDDRGLLYYQNGGLSDDLYEIDVETFAVTRTFTGEGHARQIILDRQRNRLYVLGYFSGTVFALDRETGRRLWTRRVGGLPHGMALAGDTLWVNARPGVVELNLAVLEKQP